MQALQIKQIFEMFSVEDEFIDTKAYGNGHINDTYLISAKLEKYILQKVNHHIFKDVAKLNRNIFMALKHFNEQQLLRNENRFKQLYLFPGKDGNNHYLDSKGNYWRLMNFIPDSISYDVAEKPEIAFETARAFAYFQKLTLDLNPKDFHPVIVDFHNLEKRMQAFEDVRQKNLVARNSLATEEIAFVEKHAHLSKELTELLDGGGIPVRVTHNDTKINNVLLDKHTHKGICVIDLDTLMPGTVLFDFGDMVRTFVSPAQEDEQDLSRVSIRLDIFEALTQGYLSELGEILTQLEKENLVFGGKIMTFMIGLRFLTDYLEGDVYYKTSHPAHNLHRCRTQFKLLSEIEKQEVEMQEIVRRILD